ncbi:excinuclease ABC subunit B [Mycobacterium tuberculosis variant pinnipedii]|nr:excinuclease ABC subunit B [Mycobacterium tuberculosis variant pinnipedii]
MHRVLSDRPHYALRIGIGVGDQVERLVLGWVNGSPYLVARGVPVHRHAGTGGILRTLAARCVRGWL